LGAATRKAVRKQNDGIAIRRGRADRFPYRHSSARNVDPGYGMSGPADHRQELMVSKEREKENEDGR